MAGFNVTTFEDVVAAFNEVLSLREAIDAANSSPGADEITVSETVTDSLTITGCGQATTVIDANQQSRVLNVVGESVNVASIATGTVTIEESGSDVVVRDGSTILFQGPAASLAVLDFTGTSGDDTL